MLKQKGWWKKYVGLEPDYWYAVAPRRKIADRPHLLTIVLAALSPLLAVVATIISLKSMKTSQQALIVGQRAYLAAEESRASIWGPVPSDAPLLRALYGQEGKISEGWQVVSTTFILRNLGNTPATVTYCRETLPHGTSVVLTDMLNLLVSADSIGSVPEMTGRSVEIEAKSTASLVCYAAVIHFRPGPRFGATYSYDPLPQPKPREMRVTIGFRDVFEQEHQLMWFQHLNLDDPTAVKSYESLKAALGW